MKSRPGGATFPALCFSGSLVRMTRIALAPLVALLLASGCSEQAQPPSAEASPAAESTSASAEPAPAASSASPSAAASDGPASRYTSLKNCTVVDDGGGEDWSVSRCPGLGGYDLVINYGDARDSLAIVKNGKEIAEWNLWLRAGGGFNSVGETAEWRGVLKGTTFTPRALIVRNIANRDPERPERTTELLEVFDLVQACPVASIEPRANQNAEARAIADGPARACPK